MKVVKNPEYCYIIRARDSVKIGVAVDPLKRLRELQTGNQDGLRLVCVLPGGRDFERHLHKKFGEHRQQGEWFHCGPVLHWLYEVAEIWRALMPSMEAQDRERNREEADT